MHGKGIQASIITATVDQKREGRHSMSYFCVTWRGRMKFNIINITWTKTIIINRYLLPYDLLYLALSGEIQHNESELLT